MNPLLFGIVKRVGQFAFEQIGEAGRQRETAAMNAGQLPVVTNPPILLQRGEICHVVNPSVTLFEPKVVTIVPRQQARFETRVVSEGYDFRQVAGRKAKYQPPIKEKIRVPGIAAVTETRLSPRASGVLVVTSKRVVLLTRDGPLEMMHRSLVTVTAFKDGLELERAVKPRIAHFTGKRIDFDYLARLIRAVAQSQR